MAAVDGNDPVMPEPEWAKPRDKNAPPPVYIYILQKLTTVIYSAHIFAGFLNTWTRDPIKTIAWSLVDFKRICNFDEFFTWAHDMVMWSWSADTFFWQLSIDQNMGLKCESIQGETACLGCPQRVPCCAILLYVCRCARINCLYLWWWWGNGCIHAWMSMELHMAALRAARAPLKIMHSSKNNFSGAKTIVTDHPFCLETLHPFLSFWASYMRNVWISSNVIYF